MIKDLQTKKLIDLLALQEEQIGVLYHDYSMRFPDNNFWSQISKEEFVHQQWIFSLANSSDDIYINPKRFPVEALEIMIEFIKKLQKEQENLTILKALSYSIDIERALLEKEFFTVFESDSNQVKQIFKNLELATKDHLQRVKDELSKIQMTS